MRSGNVTGNCFHSGLTTQGGDALKRLGTVGVTPERGCNIDSGHCADCARDEQPAVLVAVAEWDALRAEQIVGQLRLPIFESRHRFTCIAM
jgi:hypothetical protein